MDNYEEINIYKEPTLQDLENKVRSLELQPFSQSSVLAKNITNSFTSPAFKQGLQGWRLQDNGDVEFNNGTFRGSILIGANPGQHIFLNPSDGTLKFFDSANILRSSFDGSGLSLYDPAGILTSVLKGTNIATDGIDGFALSASGGTDFEYLFSGAGFSMPGGDFLGDINLIELDPEITFGPASIDLTPAVFNNIGLKSNGFLVLSITRSGTTATVTTSVNHGATSGDVVIISGATQTDYNGAFTITGTPALDQLTYTVTNSPATPATTTTSLQANIYDGQFDITSYALEFASVDNVVDTKLPIRINGAQYYILLTTSNA